MSQETISVKDAAAEFGLHITTFRKKTLKLLNKAKKSNVFTIVKDKKYFEVLERSKKPKVKWIEVGGGR